MGRAYNQDQRERVKVLLEAGRDEETIEKETGVSDRTIRRWKMELERTGRIGKPPESRTGRHRVLNPEVENVSPGHMRSDDRQHTNACDRRHCLNMLKTSRSCLSTTCFGGYMRHTRS